MEERGMSDKQLKILLREYLADLEEILELQKAGETSEAIKKNEKFVARLKSALQH